MSPSVPPLKTSCHCNAISLTTEAPPKLMNECQCSICRRYGAQWSYYPIDQKDHGVEVNGVPITEYHVREDGKFEVQAQSLVLPTRTYAWGDDSEWFVFCEKCGCIMFWYPQRSTAEGGNGKMGINARMVNDPMALRFVEKRITYGDAMTTKEGVYDENGPIRKP